MNETKWYNNLRRNIEIMMQTDMIREKKLKVTNEITNVMEYYNSSFLQAVPNLMLEYKRLAKEQGIELQQPKPITMGMWIGGDRDGNPFVTAETLKRSATIQSEVILNYYIQKISSLYRNFSLSTNLSKPVKRLKRWQPVPVIHLSLERRSPTVGPSIIFNPSWSKPC